MSGLDFVDIQQGKDALQDVRSDASSTDWYHDHITSSITCGS